jgi:DNA-binding transcriptional ArsR family regulator
MNDGRALDALNALGHKTRLAVFRLLVRAGPEGLPAGAIARAAGVPPSTLSSHLAQLEASELLRSTRHRQQIIYAADIDGVRGLLTFLLADCCQGRPEICGALEGLAPTRA